MRTTLGRLLLRAVGLPRIDGPPGASTSTIDALRRRAIDEGVLFHGSARDDLELLAPIRESSDTTEFGNQQAVYATSDPIWAVWFAVVSRDGLQRMANGSLAPARSTLYPRWYFFAVNAGALTRDRFRDGFVYVLPRDTFRPQRPLGGLIDTAQFVSGEPVRPLDRVRVTPADFPLLDAVFEKRSGSEIATILHAGRLGKRSRARAAS